ncbi:MAG: exodeoxyribonuclease VII large subunit [Nitritalea sp.]
MQQLSLSELSALIKSTLEEQLPPNLWVKAEIAELKRARVGHAYFDLVEKEGQKIVAKLRANCWSYTFSQIESDFIAHTGGPLKPGMEILCLVSVQYHEVFGLALVIKGIDVNFTLGNRAKRRQALLRKLEQEGLLLLNKRWRLPLVPQRVAVISSAQAAGYGDFMTHLREQGEHFHLELLFFEALMQGEQAPGSIVQALQLAIAEQPDLIVLIRGGGAQTDLDCFDDETLVRALAQAPVPIVTGIGHERDETIADLVAHTRLKTPTAVAAFLLEGFKQFDERLEQARIAMYRASQLRVEREKVRGERLQARLQEATRQRLHAEGLKLEKRGMQLGRLAERRLLQEENRLEQLQQGLVRAKNHWLRQQEQRLTAWEKDLVRLDPLRLLERGYTRTDLNGQPWVNQQPFPGDQLQVYSRQFAATAVVTSVQQLSKNNE